MKDKFRIPFCMRCGSRTQVTHQYFEVCCPACNNRMFTNYKGKILQSDDVSQDLKEDCA